MRRFEQYRIGHTRISVGSRPELVDFAELREWYWVCVTDRVIAHPPNSNFYWFPWIETEIIPYSTLYGAIITLHRLIDKLNVGNIYLFCDAGTHRSPSVFGLYLLTFHEESVQEILSTETREKYWSNPEEYAISYLDPSYRTRQTGKLIDKSFLTWIKTNADALLTGEITVERWRWDHEEVGEV